MTATPLLPGAGIDPAARVGAVHLRVADLDAMVSFYAGPLGLRLHERANGSARLGAGGRDLLVLASDPQARPAPRAPGLFHTAFLMPSRVELARCVERLATARVGLTGASDHLVSEALYLDDPEGNGIELYADRARAQWPLHEGRIAMATHALDVQDLLLGAVAARPTPPHVDHATTIGHVHLRVTDAAAAEAFYAEVLGLDVMVRYPGASFLAAGGYHHHVAINQWGTAGAPPTPTGARGLDHVELLAGDLDAIARRAGGATAAHGRLELVDPSGNRVVVRLS